MGDRLVRAWRGLRRPVAARQRSGPVLDEAGGSARAARRLARRQDPDRYCGASGWQMRAGCTDGDGGVICPVCSRHVRTHPSALVRHRVEVIEAHSA